MGLSGDPEARSRQLANLRRAPAAPVGNRRALRHGGYAMVARARLEAKALQVYDALAADAPLRSLDGGLPAHDAAMVRLLADALCRLEDVSANLRDYGLFDQDTDELRSAVDLERRLRQEAADYLDALGMTPRSRARIGLELTAAGKPSPEIARVVAPKDESASREILRILASSGALDEDPSEREN